MLFRWADRHKLIQIDRYGNVNGRKQIVKKERYCSHRLRALLSSPMDRLHTTPIEKVSFCTSLRIWKKGSLAVETAMVLPLFFMGMLTIISLMDVYKLETEKLVSLCEKTKEAGMYAYVLDDSGPSEITLPDLYSYQPIGGWISLPKIWLHNTVKVHAWTGKDPSDDENTEEEEGEEMVYLTKTGSVFHVDPDCTYLNLSIEQTSGSSISWKVNNYGEHYDACEICSRNQSPAGTVFITGSGTSYHNLETCSGLTRTVRLVPESQIHDLNVCSRCG